MRLRPRIHPVALTIAALALNLSLNRSTYADQFAYTGEMKAPHYSHTATLLPNGKVLVAGGYSGIRSSAELYDPATETWAETSPLITSRSGHTATLLTNGDVLVVGGYNVNGDTLSDAELYDPTTGKWTATDPMIATRAGHTATLLTNGDVLVIAGYSGNSHPTILSSAELYHPATGKWTGTTPLDAPRCYHMAMRLCTGKVLVGGGSSNGGPGASLATAALYDPAAGTWTQTEPMNTGRLFPNPVLLPNGNVLVSGGLGGGVLTSTEEYDAATGYWILKDPLSTPRMGHAAALLPNGKVLVAGGASGTNARSAELYNSLSGTWEPSGSTLNSARVWASVTLLQSKLVLLAGGGDGVGYLSSAELYTPTQVSLQPQPQPQMTCVGKPVSFSAIPTNGTPPYGFQWSKDDVSIPGATNSLLVLAYPQSTNEGLYSVVVSDALGSMVTSLPARLTVNTGCVDIALYAGVSFDGAVGQTYGIQSTTDLNNTNS